MRGRNELCPCGSGKKYKKCCLPKNQEIEFTRNKVIYAAGLYKNLENKMDEYSKKSNFNNYREKAKNQFYISSENNSIIDKLYSYYLLFGDVDNKGTNLARKYYDDNKLSLNRNYKNIMLSALDTTISMFKIENIEATKITLKDYFTNKKIIINDVRILKELKENKNIIGKIIKIKDLNIFMDNYIFLSDENANIICTSIKEQYKLNKSKFKNEEEFLKYNSVLIYKFIQQIIINKKVNKSVILDSDINRKDNKEIKNIQDINIYDLLKRNIEDKYFQKSIELWKHFVTCNKSIKGSQNGWAAAIEYYIKKDAGETITQSQVSKKYEISSRTLGKRYKELKAS